MSMYIYICIAQSLYMYVHVYVYVYLHSVHVCLHIYICTRISVAVHLHLYLYMYICICTCLYIHIYASESVCLLCAPRHQLPALSPSEGPNFWVVVRPVGAALGNKILVSQPGRGEDRKRSCFKQPVFASGRRIELCSRLPQLYRQSDSRRSSELRRMYTVYSFQLSATGVAETLYFHEARNCARSLTDMCWT